MKALLFFLLGVSMMSWAQEPDVSLDQQRKVIQELGDAYQNSIPILQNRFRIDFKVDEVTMVFFRENGSAPVVLVKPDGSKLFQARYSPEVVAWEYSANWDVIRISHPTPGPWQAMGQILPGSRIMVLSNVELHVDPLPRSLFAGEVLKQTGYLTNGGNAINIREFKDVVNLTIEFASANNPNYDNFGAGRELVATFSDDGRGMDEYPNDGTFSGQYNLGIKPGEWVPIYVVKTPVISREQRGAPIRLYPNPISLDVKLDDHSHDVGYHQLTISGNSQLIDMRSLMIDGKVRFPNGETQHFSLTDAVEEPRQYAIHAFDHGVFRVKITAFGNTKDGRNFVIDVPEYAFTVEPPPPPKAAETKVAEPTGPTAEELAAIQAAKEQAEREHLQMVIFISVISVLLLLVLVMLVLILIKRRKQAKVSKIIEQSHAGDDLMTLEIPREKP